MTTHSASLLSRVLVFTFGVISYFVGVAALLALIFVMLGVVPFNGGPIGPLSTGAAMAVNFGLLIAFALQHSVMARPTFKRQWIRLIPQAAERSAYVLATGLFLFPVLALWQPMPTLIWSVTFPALRWALLGLGVAGWVYLFVASFAINHFELFGLQQVYQFARGHTPVEVPFKERWMYRLDRHPIMTGILVGMWVTPTMTLGHLFFSFGFSAYVVVGVYFEERGLLRQWGPLYVAYRARTWSIVPTFHGNSGVDARSSVRS